MGKKAFILDTNVYLTNYESVLQFGRSDIIIPLRVLDEIDKHKKRQDLVGHHCRMTIRFLDKLRSKGNLSKGVRLAPYKGKLFVRGFDPFILPDDLDLEDSDNQILATTLTVIKKGDYSKVTMVSRDINVRVKCDSLNISCQDYLEEKVIEDVTSVYRGVAEETVEDALIDEIYDGNIAPQRLDSIDQSRPNEFKFLKSDTNPKKGVFLRKSRSSDFKRITNKQVWSLKPRNKEQMLAVDLLMDVDVPLVSLVGKAGTGKTLLALAAGLEQVINQKKYNRIIVTKPVQPVGKDIGFLPGTLEEKMAPWIAPIKDNLNYLFKGDKMTMGMYFDEGVIEVEAMTFIRGRSITDSYIIIDEVQNMTQHEIKTVLTRVGENTKIILTGDIQQIDNVYINSTTNGLTYVVEKFKDQPVSGHIMMINGERSEVATIAADIL